MKFTRHWAMASPETFTIEPIRLFVKKYLSGLSIDPFARNCGWATYTNDLDDRTSAQYHMDCRDFLNEMRDQGVQADVVIFDPPYSPRQIKEVYDGIGLKMGGKDAWRTHSWSKEKAIIDDLLKVGGVFLSFGWNSHGIGKKYGYSTEEILLVSHGAGHNDTICMVERKLSHQMKLEDVNGIGVGANLGKDAQKEIYDGSN